MIDYRAIFTQDAFFEWIRVEIESFHFLRVVTGGIWCYWVLATPVPDTDTFITRNW